MAKVIDFPGKKGTPLPLPNTYYARQIKPPVLDHKGKSAWVDILEFMIRMTEPGDPSLEFFCGLYEYASKNNGLTKAQARIAGKYFDAALQKYYTNCEWLS